MHVTEMFILGFFFLVLKTSGVLSQVGVCNQCSVYNAKCISPTQYQFCNFATGGAVVSDIFTCTTGEKCNTINASPCAVGFLPECPCGICVPDDIKACISDTQFQVCRDGTPTAPSISCPTGTKCDGLTLGNLCSADGVSGCPAEVVVLKCTAAGRYPVPKTLCKQYYLCSYVNSAWMMYYYNCTGTFNFDPSLQKCTSTYACPLV